MSLWSRIVAACYDPLLSRFEREWLGSRRELLLAQATGRVLEIGGGTGANLPYYQSAGLVILTEPEPAMLKRAQHKKPHSPAPLALQAARAEALPFAAASFDTVVSTLVLCTVADLEESLAEIRRVLRPQGRLLFIEHVRGEGRHGRWQSRIAPFWSRIALGCHPDRTTLEAIQRSGFELADCSCEEPDGMPRLFQPVCYGTALISP